MLDYTPDWKRKEDERAEKQSERAAKKEETSAPKDEPTPAPLPAEQQASPPPLAKGDAQAKDYDFPELMKKSPLVELTMDKVRGSAETSNPSQK